MTTPGIILSGFEGWVFFENTDAGSDDIGCLRDATPMDMKLLADTLAECECFNTNGWMKRSASTMSYYKYENGGGLFVKINKVPPNMQIISPVNNNIVNSPNQPIVITSNSFSGEVIPLRSPGTILNPGIANQMLAIPNIVNQVPQTPVTSGITPDESSKFYQEVKKFIQEAEIENVKIQRIGPIHDPLNLARDDERLKYEKILVLNSNAGWEIELDLEKIFYRSYILTTKPNENFPGDITKTSILPTQEDEYLLQQISSETSLSRKRKNALLVINCDSNKINYERQIIAKLMDKLSNIVELIIVIHKPFNGSKQDVEGTVNMLEYLLENFVLVSYSEKKFNSNFPDSIQLTLIKERIYERHEIKLKN